MEVFFLLFFCIFLFTFGMIFYTSFQNIKRERHNDRAPRLTVEAKVVAKRTNFRRSSDTNHSIGHGNTTYFATFEVSSGDRMELQMPGAEYGLLVEGDLGDLTFQGTRYLSFQRKIVHAEI